MTRVVLLHGSADSPAVWRGVVERLPAAWTVQALDGRKVSNPLEPALRTASEPIHGVGHSYGGLLVLKSALAAPERLASLSLIEPIAFELLGGREDELLATVRRALAPLLHGTGSAETGMEAMIDFWFGAGTWASAGAALQRRLLASGEAASQQTREAASFGPRPEELARIDTPTLLISGAASHPAGPALCRILDTLLPQSTIRQLRGARHDCPRTHPAPIAAWITEHIQRAEAAV